MDSDTIIQSLHKQIQTTITNNGGMIGFDDYLQRVLYTPELGYYCNDTDKFGSDGDFITAAESSALYAACIAVYCQRVLAVSSGDTILEIGGGSGRLAVNILSYLHWNGQLPQHYLIYEPSAILRQRQQEIISRCDSVLSTRIHWPETLPVTAFNGAIIASEVIDALPFKCFRIGADDTIEERCVAIHSDTACNGDISYTPFCWQHKKADAALTDAVHATTAALPEPLSAGYCSEINLQLTPFLRTLASCLVKGSLLFIDYGYPNKEYYHPQRRQGTLLCHYRHRVHENPFTFPGLQDITASVNFSALAQAAGECQLQLVGYTSQLWFLLDCGIDRQPTEWLQQNGTRPMEITQQLRQLLQPDRMGERFKVVAFSTAGLSTADIMELPGFTNCNQSHQL